MKLGGKIATVCGGAILGTSLIAYYIMDTFMREEAIHFTQNSMRGAMIQAETVRDNMSLMAKNKAFDKAGLLKELEGGKDYRQTTIYQTIPVVAAWQTVEKLAQKEGYKFRVPKHQPRNPANQPTPEEAQILDELEKSNKPEYFKIDKKRDTLIYARPIRLTPDCLSCHGDPATSPTGDGKDILGMKMEDWKSGELHGAFVLEADMKRVMSQVDTKVGEALGRTAAIMIPFIALLGYGIWWFNRYMVVKPLTSAIHAIEEASAHTSTASEEISSSSQQLAEGASEQASSLEETSASLEEMTSMTSTNLEGAQNATNLANQALKAADKGREEIEHMFTSVKGVQDTTQQLASAMDGITASSHSISTVIKTIDEIAFQTNILALNAAVEAARAGEAGMGFAVVADEVRALAQRSAGAAKETAQLIEDSVRKSKAGVEVSNKVTEDLKGIHLQAEEVNVVLKEIVLQNNKVNEAIAHIASACREQNQGVQQISTAVSQMDKVTQSNAATSEESAAAAAELHEQAESLRASIIHLVDLIGNDKTNASSQASSFSSAPKSLRAQPKGKGHFGLPME